MAYQIDVGNILTPQQAEKVLECFERGHGPANLTTTRKVLREVGRLAVHASLFNLVLEGLVDLDWDGGELQFLVPHCLQEQE